MKKLFKGLLVLFLAVLLTGCGDSDDNEANASGEDVDGDKEVLKMATSADFPPFETRDTDGNFEGFDIDLAHLIAEELGYELEIEDMKFDGLIGSLQAGRVDFVMSGMSATEDRKKNVDFSHEYHRSGEMFLSLEDDAFDDLESLEGKVVGVQLGTIQEEGAETLQEEYDFDIKKLDDSTILIQELLSKRIDFAYMDKQVALGYMDAQDLFGTDDPTTVSPGMGVAFPKGSDLVDNVNEILEMFEEDGTLEELRDKWLKDEE